MNLILVRSQYTAASTIGDLIVRHALYCHTLEDPVHPIGSPKVPGKTAIPAGRYKVVINLSARFKKLMPLLVNVPGFTGVRFHGGNTAEDTEGCVLVARSIVGPDKVQGSMSDELTELLRTTAEENFVEIINAFPYTGLNRPL